MANLSVNDLIKSKNIMTKEDLKKIEKRFIEFYKHDQTQNVNKLIGRTLSEPEGYNINVSYYNMVDRRLKNIYKDISKERKPNLDEVIDKVILNKDKYTPKINKNLDKER